MNPSVSDDVNDQDGCHAPSPSLRKMLTIVDTRLIEHEASEASPSTTSLLARLESFLPKIAAANDQLAAPSKSLTPDVVERVASKRAPLSTSPLVERHTTRLSMPSTKQPDGHSITEEVDSVARVNSARQTAGKPAQPQRRLRSHETVASVRTHTSGRALAVGEQCVGLPPARADGATDVTDDSAVVEQDQTSSPGELANRCIVEMHLFVDDSLGELVPSADAVESRPLIREVEAGPTDKPSANK